MSDYKKKVWSKGDVITSEALNNLETGVTEAKKEAEQAALLRVELQELSDRINAVLDSDDTTLDELSEIVAYIKSNKSLIDAITTSKVSVTDIVNNLTTNVTNKPLSAAQGVALKALIDALTTTVSGKEASGTAARLINRSTAVNAADTNYTTLMARGSSLNSAETTPAVNGAIAWTYE